MKLCIDRNKYFTAVFVMLIATYMILPTSKSVNNFYYLFGLTPGIFFLFKYRYFKPVLIFDYVFALLCLYYALNLYFISPDKIKDVLYVYVFVMAFSRQIDSNFLTSKYLARLLFWGAIIYACISAFSNYIIGDLQFGVPVNPGISRLDNPIHTSMFMACTIFIISPIWLTEKRWLEAGLGFILNFIAISLIFQSRSGLVGMALWALIFCYALIKEYGHKVVWGLLLVCVFGILVSLPLFDLAGQTTQLVDRADSNRFAIWKGYLSAINDCGWILGCGFPEHISDKLVWEDRANNIFGPHNIYIHMIYRLGIMSFILFLISILVALFYSYNKKMWWGGYLLAGLLMLNFDGSMIMNSPNEVWLLVWLPITVIMSINLRSNL